MDEDIISPRPEPPPLRIHHLMACAVVAAVELSLMRFLLSLSPQQQTLASAGIYGFTQVLNAVGLTLTGFSIYWWRKGYASFSQPGQMLLIQYAASLVLQLLGIVFTLAMFKAGGAPRNTSAMWVVTWLYGGGSLLFGILLPMAFYAWCAWRVADSWSWRVLFMLCALTTVLTSTVSIIAAQMFWNFSPSNIQMIVGLPYVVRGALLFTVGVLVLVADLTTKRDRSWTHWAGIFLWISGQVGSLLMGLFYMFIWQVS